MLLFMSPRRLLFLGLLFLLSFYSARWLSIATGIKKRRWLFAIFLFVAATGWQFAYRMGFPATETFAHWFYWGSAVTLSFLVSFLLLALPFDIVRIIGTGLTKLFKKPVFNPERRALLKRGSALGLLGSAGVIGTVGLRAAVQIPKVKEVVVPIANLPLPFEGFTIAQISDLHVGPTIRKSYVQRVVEATNAANPDVVALTGDMVDGHVDRLSSHVEPLGRLKSKHGIYYVTGNHEYYWGVDPWIKEFERLGAISLVNESRILSRDGAKLCLSGVPDTSGSRYNPQHLSTPHEALKGIEPGLVKVLLAHRPQSCFEASKAGFDLQLCGHTHAGQFFPWSLFVPFAHPYYKGLNRHENMYVYVNPGTGYWGPPNRFAVPTEITLIRLTKA